MTRSAGRPSGPWAIIAPVRAQIRLAMALACIGAAAGVGALGALAFALGQAAQAPGRWPWPALAAGLVLTVLSYVLRLLAFNQSHYAAFDLERRLRRSLARHLGMVSLGTLQSAGQGALAKVLQDDVKALHVFVADSTPLYARAYALPVVTLLALLVLDWRLAAAAAAVVVVGVGGMSLAMRDHVALMRRYNQAREQVTAAVIEFVQAMPVVRSFDGGSASFGRYQRALDAYLVVLSGWYRAASFSGRFSLGVLGPLPTMAVLLSLGCWLLAHDALSLSHWIAVLLVGTGMAEAMMPLMSLKQLVNKAQMSVTRIDEVMALPAQQQQLAATRLDDPAGSVRFDAVTFGYAPGSTALADVSFLARPGTLTALVGPSGAGKSTVARLIPRFWDVEQGRVLIGGVDVRTLPTDALMGMVGFVFQETFLFADTVANNIRLGLPDASQAQIERAARSAHAHDFIMGLPQGYDSLVGERGTSLSGGQRQRITIARAILQDRPILVLDEPTSFADPESEAEVMAALAALMRGRTTLMVAHRLSAIQHAEQILVFERGRLAEHGRHDSLLLQGGVYARLWSNYEAARHWVLGAAQAEPAR